LLAFEQYGNRISAHGVEWKKIYAMLLQQFLEHKIFPADIERELLQSMRNPAASSCAEDGLIRILRKYDDKKNDEVLVEEIPKGSLFSTVDGKIFCKGEKQRKRYKCVEVKTKRIFLFSPVYEVKQIIDNR
jgi:hypothetical protein